MNRLHQLFSLSIATWMLAGLALRADEVPPQPESASASQSEALNVFEGMQAKQVAVKLTQRNEKTGTLFVRNNTDQPLIVEIPAAFVGVHIFNAAQLANGQASPRVAAQSAQSTGVSINEPVVSVSGDAPGPESPDQAKPNQKPTGKAAETLAKPRRFDVPAGKTVQFPVTSVCLEYGKLTPNAKMAYLIIPVEKYSRNPVLHELLPLFAKVRVNQDVAQAAAWHVSNGMTWREIAGVMGQGPVPVPMFDARTLQQANLLVNEATAIAIKRRNSATTPKSPRTEPRSKRSAPTE